MHRNSRLQLLLQLCQGQVGLNLDPARNRCSTSGVTCAAIHAVARSAPLSAMLALRGNLPRPRQAHREARRQLIQRALPRSWPPATCDADRRHTISPSSVCRRVSPGITIHLTRKCSRFKVLGWPGLDLAGIEIRRAHGCALSTLRRSLRRQLSWERARVGGVDCELPAGEAGLFFGDLVKPSLE